MRMRILGIIGLVALAVLAVVVWRSSGSRHVTPGALPGAAAAATTHAAAQPGGSTSQPAVRPHPSGRQAGAAGGQETSGAPATSSAPGGSPTTSGPARRPRSPAPTASPSPPFVPDQADLQAALLTAAQLPGSGYQEQQPGSGPGLSSLKECPALNAGQSGITAQVNDYFVSGNAATGAETDVSEGLFQDTVTGARQMVGAFRTAVASCGSFSFTVKGVPFAVSAALISFPSMGDQTAAVQVTVSQAAAHFSISGDVVAIRLGGTVIVITNVGYPTLSTGLTDAVASDAYAKVASRW
jgi:hypothetical protein